MLKLVYEGQLDSFVKSNTQLVAGQLVKLNAADPTVVEVAGAGDKVHGLVSTDVIDATSNNFKLGNVILKARVGERVGVFIQDGVYITDQYVGVVPHNAALYAGASGQLTATSGGAVVATALSSGNGVAGSQIRIKLVI